MAAAQASELNDVLAARRRARVTHAHQDARPFARRLFKELKLAREAHAAILSAYPASSSCAHSLITTLPGCG